MPSDTEQALPVTAWACSRCGDREPGTELPMRDCTGCTGEGDDFGYWEPKSFRFSRGHGGKVSALVHKDQANDALDCMERELSAEIRKLRDTVAALRPVVDAAVEWVLGERGGKQKRNADSLGSSGRLLGDAVEAYKGWEESRGS